MLFVEIVSSMTNQSSDAVYNEAPPLASHADLADYLEDYAFTQLSVVLTQHIMQLRRLVIRRIRVFS